MEKLDPKNPDPEVWETVANYINSLEGAMSKSFISGCNCHGVIAASILFIPGPSVLKTDEMEKHGLSVRTKMETETAVEAVYDFFVYRASRLENSETIGDIYDVDRLLESPASVGYKFLTDKAQEVENFFDKAESVADGLIKNATDGARTIEEMLSQIIDYVDEERPDDDS